MNLKSILGQFSNSSGDSPMAGPDGNNPGNAFGNTLGKITSQLPGGLAGGAVAGGIMSLIMTNKSARKTAGTVAAYGSAALLGGLAYKAYKNWQTGHVDQSPVSENSFSSPEILSPEFQLTLIKGMIGAANADGHIDAEEQKRIFSAIDDMDLSTEAKALVFDLIRQPVSIPEIASGAHTMKQKTELYLVSSMVINPDHPAEQQWLNDLAQAMALPASLAAELRAQAQQQLIAA